MKKNLAVVTVLSMALTIGGTAIAQCGKDGGCGDCNQTKHFNQGGRGRMDSPETALNRQFMQNTLDLRQEMMNKRFELQRENLNATPDTAKIAALKAEVGAIQAKINEVRVQMGLTENGKRDGECFKAGGGCSKQGGMGGCNGQPCGMN